MKYEHVTSAFYQIQNLASGLQNVLQGRYPVTADEIDASISPLVKLLKPSLYAHIEYPYVDRVYRDSYYHYFSSKHEPYSRDAVRVGIFDGPIEADDFNSEVRRGELNDRYFGFFVVRPTPPNLIGRSMISPAAYQNRDFVCCMTSVSSAISGVSLDAHAFPHASQDIESMSCAETSIWSVMEYFGTKYPEYRPVVPSEIIDVFSTSSFQRLLPSSGLTIFQISRALRLFGLSTRVYSRTAYSDEEFQRLMNIYVESGIPIVAGLRNSTLGHAIVLVGHANFSVPSTSPEYSVRSGSTKADNLLATDTADIARPHVIIDDNWPPYQIHDFLTSGPSYYSQPAFKNLQIDSFVAPLHSRIYLEAFKARALVDTVLENRTIGWRTRDTGIGHLWIRFFLTSSRSFKIRVRQTKDIANALQELLIGFSMPKFIWVAELTTRELYLKDRAFGLILIDATGGDTIDSVELILYPDRLLYFRKRLQIESYSVQWGDFLLYRNNLKGEWSEWKAS